jgi:hypothetical protein
MSETRGRHIEDPLQMTLMRLAFYRRRMRLMFLAVASLGLGVLIAGKYALGAIAWQPTPYFFAIDVRDRPIQERPLYMPLYGDGTDSNGQPHSYSTAQLLHWAEERALQMSNINFINYRVELQELRSGFTTAGWNDWIDAMTDANRVYSLEVKRERSTARLRLAARVVREQNTEPGSGQTHAWRIVVPLTVTLQSYEDRSTSTFERNVIFTVVRVSEVQSPDAVAIAQVVECRPSADPKLSTCGGIEHPEYNVPYYHE